ncbi:glycine betaine/L-proline ABC transporter ATP-binding protein [uncultured Tateyamaria sp.]|uniref:quaternary amine ABC transporter ATP-binding protein n=1 Tax=uncultured Tateyamaria sp. TaxID=455651 RepID=UPI00262E7B02|nr:betaine/proline/choline family ABC transporter ATP-binding protein [uncultured Tateyamaria sp.]
MSKNAKIEVSGLYKVFGAKPAAALEHVYAGASKTQLLADHGHVLGLQDINIKMNEGDITVVMGLSGSGKSTLIRHINYLIEPTAGSIVIDGKDITKMDAAGIRRMRQSKMSMVFQNFALLPHRTVLQNAALAPISRGDDKAESLEKALYWLNRVGLAGIEDQYPYQLSGGMQQRVGIARALTSDSDIMLMDEAFSALDPLIRTDMQGLLLELQAELRKTVVFITHDLDEALRLADHLVILKDGAVVQQGEPQHILIHPADAYIEEFVNDINRARVLRARSVMSPPDAGYDGIQGAVDHQATLESVIAMSHGDTTIKFRVQKEGEDVGVLDMNDLVRALVPKQANDANHP